MRILLGDWGSAVGSGAKPQPTNELVHTGLKKCSSGDSSFCWFSREQSAKLFVNLMLSYLIFYPIPVPGALWGVVLLGHSPPLPHGSRRLWSWFLTFTVLSLQNKRRTICAPEKRNSSNINIQFAHHSESVNTGSVHRQLWAFTWISLVDPVTCYHRLQRLFEFSDIFRFWWERAVH